MRITSIDNFMFVSKNRPEYDIDMVFLSEFRLCLFL